MSLQITTFCASFLLLITSTNAGQFAVLHNPNTIRFKDGSPIRETMLKEIFSASLGLSSDDYSYWDGLEVLTPFDPPEAIVMVNIDGMGSLTNFVTNAKLYTLITEEKETRIFEAMKERIRIRNTKDSKFVNLRLSESFDPNSYSDIFGILNLPKVPKQRLNFLKYSVEEDYLFLTELEMLKSIKNAVNTHYLKVDDSNDFFSFKFNSFNALCTYHGAQSLQAGEAKKLLSEQVKELSQAFVKTYYGNVMVTVVSSDAGPRRPARSPQDDPPPEPPAEPPAEPAEPPAEPPAEEAPPPPPPAPPASTGDSDDFPVIFNLIMGLCLTFSFSMLTIVYAIMNMDPGRESVIYRMTTMRNKKEL